MTFDCDFDLVLNHLGWVGSLVLNSFFISVDIHFLEQKKDPGGSWDNVFGTPGEGEGEG